MAATGSLSLDNPVFTSFAFYCIVVLFKMFALGFLTGYWRQRKNVFLLPEDVPAFSHKPDTGKVSTGDPDVERARKNHHNDLENIPSFILIGLLYVLIEPSPFVALWHFRVFVGMRILHTIAYQFSLQPWRAIFHLATLLAQISMGVQVLMATL